LGGWEKQTAKRKNFSSVFFHNGKNFDSLTFPHPPKPARVKQRKKTRCKNLTVLKIMLRKESFFAASRAIFGKSGVLRTSHLTAAKSQKRKNLFLFFKGIPFSCS
jgi:hypothetical protein